MTSRITGSALGLLAGALLLASGPQPAPAQELSGRPIRLLVGLAAGGATDVMARLMAQKMSESMRTTVLVENKVGGNFIPALRELTGSPPDGNTLYFISTSSLITQPLHPDYPFDLTRLTPVTPENEISLLCRCGHFIARRRDSFLPGTHVIICLQCGNISTEVERLDGTTVAVTAASHRDGGQ